MQSLPITNGMKLFNELFPNGPECEFSRFHFAEESRVLSLFHAAIAICPSGVGLEMKSASREAWAVILPEMSRPDTHAFREQTFDERGFSGHYQSKDPLSSLEDLIRQGYEVIDQGALDRNSQTQKWRQGMAESALVQKHHEGRLTYPQLLSQIGELRAAA